MAAAIAAATLCMMQPAAAESPTEALRAFGLPGTWSPDCGGPYRTIYAAPGDAAATVRVLLHDQEIAASEIREVARTANRITWTSVITAWSLSDIPRQSWMPEPGEVWETEIERLDDKIRPVRSQRRDGGKISVRDGFIYTAEPGPGTDGLVWHSTQKPTLPLERCGTDKGAGALDRVRPDLTSPLTLTASQGE